MKMKRLFLLIMIVPIYSFKCINSKHFMTGKPNIFVIGKCKIFPKNKRCLFNE